MIKRRPYRHDVWQVCHLHVATSEFRLRLDAEEFGPKAERIVVLLGCFPTDYCAVWIARGPGRYESNSVER